MKLDDGRCAQCSWTMVVVRLRLVRLEQEALPRDGDYVNYWESEHLMFKTSVPVEAHVTVEGNQQRPNERKWSSSHPALAFAVHASQLDHH